ncbi:DUF493 domain-containing protein [Halorhodospira halochloris]|uniref:Proposed lipoate regulatory protein YbeD n=1 Tax=Halorhodospira halochloris TaxID=1052 RepID=A0A110B6P6_HALHR|nr:DUF493 domain-containing protein [Halorhodospira halochloris]MBK1650987.1 DUF493 domain-containing protein [Halorhodospira halochloris]MCG5529354.1 DUF493 domain-containing protein [Halorhodospira halochloris]MCG5547329.1 DUF493 domain-containing protein [Halorhodospira halochloris]BAU56503.1 proposed lipoate regulatory protein YbeD [Halorhodospira halochloris]
MSGFDSETTPLEFPCQVGIKAMGSSTANLTDRVEEIASSHAQVVNTKTTASRNGRYVSVTVTVEASSREQLEDIYGALQSDDAVIMTL